MKTCRISLAAAGLALSAATTTLFAQAPSAPTPPGQRTPAQLKLLPKAIDAPDIKYEVVKDFMKLPPNVYMGEGIGVATNSKGHVFVNTCAQQTRNFEFDQNGNFVREIGKDLYGFVFCHGIRVDAQDNIWVIDEGANSIIKFNPEGRVTMILGRRIGFVTPYVVCGRHHKACTGDVGQKHIALAAAPTPARHIKDQRMTGDLRSMRSPNPHSDRRGFSATWIW